MQAAAINVWGVVIENCGHFVAKEQRKYSFNTYLTFLHKKVTHKFSSIQQTIHSMVNSNLELIAQWYKTVNPELLDEQIVWEKAENFLGGGVALGRDAVFSEVFASIGQAFQPWSAVVETMFDGGDHQTVIVLGRYMGKALATDRDISAPFAHIWRVLSVKIVFARQYTDTFGIAKAQGLL